MRKFLIILLIILLIPTSAGAGALVAKYTSTEIYIDGQKLNAPVYTIGNYTNAPTRALAEGMGATVTYDKDKNRINIQRPLTDLETVVKNCKDSCVMIYVYKDGQFIGNGSGWVYGGYVITAKHVTDAGNSFKVFTDDAKYGIDVTEVVKFDTNLDVSALKVNTGMPSVKLGDSDRLVEGEKLVSITSPKNIQNAIDECINSGKIEVVDGSFLSVSESGMESGSSGGPIFNYKSEIISMCKSGELYNNYTVPINGIIPLLEKLK